MAVDGQLLRGEVSENPKNDEKKDIEQLLSSFLHALVLEYSPNPTAAPVVTPVLALPSQGEVHHEC